MKSGRSPRLLAAVFAGLALGSAHVLAATIDVNSVTRASNGTGGYTYSTWKPVIGPGDAPLMDPVYDQQTGQGDSDFVSATVNGVANPGFFVQFGQVNNVDSIAFRIMLNEYKTTGNLVNIRFGFDGNYDGKMDLYMGLSQQNNQYGLVFQAPGTGANISPSTSDYGNPFVPAGSNYAGGTRPTSLGALNTQGNAIAVTSSNFSNIAIGDGVNKDQQGGQGTVLADNRSTYYPGWVTQGENNATSLDSMITYVFSLADINAALASLNAGFSVTPDRLMRWVAVTATQNNAVNQDAYGFTKTQFNDPNATYASVLPYMDAYGRPVPEAATYGLSLGAGLGAFLFLRRRRPAVVRAA